MLPPKLVFVLAVCLLVLNPDHVQSRKVSWDVLPSPTVCLNCTICQTPCLQTAPPPPPAQLPEPIYGIPPPPPAAVPDNPYYAPPPPGVNCSQVPQACCHPPPQYPLGYQPPPYPYGYQPPPYGYQPVVENHSRSFSPSYFLSVVLLLASTVLRF